MSAGTTMNSGSRAALQPMQPPDVLGELLHSLSQPLTGLRCSLELSLQEAAEPQQERVAAALQQTEKVIAMVQLMREYVDAEQPAPMIFSTALLPVIRDLIEELSSIAAVRDVEVRFAGSCTATVPVPESRLRLALQYLIAATIEAQSAGGKVLLGLTESPAGAVLRVEGVGVSRVPLRPTLATGSGASTTLRRVRLAIARRVLETAGASLVLVKGNGGDTGFVLRIPPRIAPCRTHSFPETAARPTGAHADFERDS
jgi:hypothetical protein